MAKRKPISADVAWSRLDGIKSMLENCCYFTAEIDAAFERVVSALTAAKDACPEACYACGHKPDPADAQQEDIDAVHGTLCWVLDAPEGVIDVDAWNDVNDLASFLEEEGI